MNDGGSVLGGNQSTSGGTDAPILQNSSPTLETDPYTQEFMESLQSPDSVVEDKSKKPKKGLVIAILFAAVALIVVSVVAFLSFSNTSTTPVPQNPEPQAPESYVANFYSYANDLLYGTDSTDPLGDQADEQYYFYEQHIYNGPDSDQGYVNQIYKSYLTFYESVPTSNTKLYDAATDYKDLLEFLRISPSSDSYSYTSVIETYLDKGADSAKQSVERSLSRIPDNQYSKDFIEAKEEELNKTLEYMQAIDKAGCIKNKTADQQCVTDFDNKTYASEEDNPLQVAIQLNQESYDVINDYYDQIASDCWKIKEVLEGNN